MYPKFLIVLSLAVSGTVANLDKTIFLGPEAVPIPQQPPTISDLRLPTLSPGNSSIRTRLDREFPQTDEYEGGESRGVETWLLLDDLTEGQRYEVKVCWAAIEPTNFDLEVFPLSEVWDTPSLIQSLASYAFAQQPSSSEDETPQVHHPADNEKTEKISSVLLLRVIAAADYFTDDAKLMSNPPPVLVDLILDPFLFNVLPRSLLPTVGYILVVAAVSFIAARFIMSYLSAVASSTENDTKKKQ